MPKNDVPDFFLYHTLGCHLCEEAEAIVRPLATQLQLSYARVDIADDDALVELYGIRIPVLRHCNSGRELGWPFAREEALLFMGMDK